MISPSSVSLWVAFVFILASGALPVTHSFPVFWTGILIGCISMMLAVLERGGEE